MIVAVIPAFNEAATIFDVISRCNTMLEHIIVVDDGSTDQTIAQAEKAGAIIVALGENFGKANALIKGMEHALNLGATSIVTLDGDGQHRPEDIARLCAVANQTPNNIVIGSRMGNKENFPRKRYIANCVANFWISWACGYCVEDSQSGFRIYPTNLITQLDIKHGRKRSFVFESEILIEAAKRGVKSVPVAIPALYEGTTKRASHFRPIYDITQIVLMVAWKLLSRGLYLQGLYLSLQK